MQAGDAVWRERALRSAVLAGDEQAWQTLYDGDFAALYAYVHWRCGGRADSADEAVQETWLTAVRRIATFDPERGSFLAWLRGIAANVLRNQQRRLDRIPPPRPAPDVPPASETLEARERSACVACALAELPDHYEAVLRAKYLDANSVEQIAADMHETPKAVESLLTRARQAFRAAYLRYAEPTNGQPRS
ncbi:hypothetical protein AYO44_06355 [Planctomycetaceae bacterium SCGC AG-212-F19]|nr:hypothetical protein AYO44_06355 [Planctomycetaceae bacterium SCGC AG-212-F19]